MLVRNVQLYSSWLFGVISRLRPMSATDTKVAYFSWLLGVIVATMPNGLICHRLRFSKVSCPFPIQVKKNWLFNSIKWIIPSFCCPGSATPPSLACNNIMIIHTVVKKRKLTDKSFKVADRAIHELQINFLLTILFANRIYSSQQGNILHLPGC